MTGVLLAAGTREAKPGRPIQSHCKRGHNRIPNQPCRACRQLRRMKYQNDEEFRARKKKQVSEYRKAFVEKNGFWPSELYDRKPKTKAVVVAQ